MKQGKSPVIQWLGHSTFTARGWVQSLFRELRSCKLWGMAKKKKKKLDEVIRKTKIWHEYK